MKTNYKLKNYTTIYISASFCLQKALSHWTHDILRSDAQVDVFIIAIDTEFVRTQHYYSKPGLIQLSLSHEVLLIDTLTISKDELSKAFTAFFESIASMPVYMAFHAPHEDIQLLSYLGIPTPFQAQFKMIDTQLAAHTLGYGSQNGLFKLASCILNKDIQGSESRSNWLNRPLSWNQIHYAAQDVILLQPLAQKLIQGLKAIDWLEQHFQETKYFYGIHLQLLKSTPQGLRSKILHKVPRPHRDLFATLVAWRDLAVKTLDIPKSWHLHDLALAKLAQLGRPFEPPALADCVYTIQQSKALKSLPKKEEALHYFHQSMQHPHIEEAFYNCWFETIDLSNYQQPVYFGLSMKPFMKKIEKIIKTQAKILKVPAEVLVPKQCLQSLIQTYVHHNFSFSMEEEEEAILCFFKGPRLSVYTLVLEFLDQHKGLLKKV